LEREVEGLVDDLGGKAWARSFDELDELAKQLGHRPLNDFISATPEQMAERIESGNLLPDQIVPEAWYPAEDGLRTIRGLLGHLRHAPQSPHRAQPVIPDLESAERILLTACQRGVHFHLTFAV
jgi:hypothetical protein